MIRQLKAETPKELFFKKAPAAVLINIFEKSPTYASQIGNDTNITFAHLNDIVKILEKYGLIAISKKTGRMKYISITEQGKDIAASIMAIISFKVI